MLYWKKIFHALAELLLYFIILYKRTIISAWILFILLMNLVNGAQFFNVTFLFILSTFLVDASGHAPEIIIVSFTSMYTSVQLQIFGFSRIVSSMISPTGLYVPYDSSSFLF